MFEIRMGVPEMKALWDELCNGFKNGTLSSDDAALYKKLGKALSFLSANPKHPGLKSHEIAPLSKRYGTRVWQSYLENNTPGAGRIYWIYGPGQRAITVIGLEPHPEDRKSIGYEKVRLSSSGKIQS